jgi:RNA polymerase sigma factor (sigma-70 family)
MGSVHQAELRPPIGCAEHSAVLDYCCKRACRWLVPPNWSHGDWFDEVRAQAAVAACQAIRDYEPLRGVAFESFLKGRLHASLLARYRKEWAFASRMRASLDGDTPQVAAPVELAETSEIDSLLKALARLPRRDFRLLRKLFWDDCTEFEVGRSLGISHQAVSKRKHVILKQIRKHLGSPPSPK